MLYRIIKSENSAEKADGAEFADFEEIAPYAREAVLYMAAIGAVSGTNQGKIEPNRTASRAEAAKLIYETLKKFEAGTGAEDDEN